MSVALPIKIAFVNTKDTSRMLNVSVAVVRTYIKKGKLQRISVGADRLIPLYEIADLLGITFKEAMVSTGRYGIVVCLTWMEVSHELAEG